MLADVLILVIVLIIGGLMGISALLVFIYALWAMQENEADRNHSDSVRQNKGNPW